MPADFYARPGLNIEIYDAVSPPPVAGDVAFYLGQARAAGGAALELGVGTGRVAWALAEAGIEVVGLDRSDAMLAAAEAKRPATPAAARLQLVRGDMADFELGRRFGLVVIPFRAFQVLLEPADQRRCLQACLRHLEPGGRLVIDLFDPLLHLCLPADAPGAPAGEQPRHTVRHPASGNEVQVVAVSRTNDPLRQVLTEVWRFRELGPGGEVLREEHEGLALRWTYRQEMRYLLELCGYEVLGEYSDFEGAPPAYGREQIWVAAPASPGARSEAPPGHAGRRVRAGPAFHARHADTPEVWRSGRTLGPTVPGRPGFGPGLTCTPVVGAGPARRPRSSVARPGPALPARSPRRRGASVPCRQGGTAQGGRTGGRG